MTRRHGLYLTSAVAAGGLLLELGWCVLDPKGDARQHIIDRGVRVLTRARDLLASDERRPPWQPSR